jgi:hypothetical protein
MNIGAYIATKDNGELACWGSKPYFGSCPNTASTFVDYNGVTVNYPKPIKYIYSGGSGWCILYTDTTVHCWFRYSAVKSPPGTGWLTIATTGSEYAALNKDGSIH